MQDGNVTRIRIGTWEEGTQQGQQEQQGQQGQQGQQEQQGQPGALGQGALGQGGQRGVERGESCFLPEYGSGHLLLTGGKLTEREGVLRSLAQDISAAGISVFATDVGGTLSGLGRSLPCTLWDLNGKNGLPFRTTVTELGPTLLSFLLGSNENQQELMRIIFKIADDNGLLLIDTKDLKALLDVLLADRQSYEREYGGIPVQTVSAILHDIVSLETRGAEAYLFEPAIDVQDLLPPEVSGSGRLHVLDAREQGGQEKLYAAFLLYLLGELYENLPDAGEEDGLALVLMIGEAQLFVDVLSASLRQKTGRILEGLLDKGVLVCLAAEEEAALPAEWEMAVSDIWRLTEGSGSIDVCMEDGMAPAAPLSFTLTHPIGRLKALSAKERSALIAEDPLHEKYKIPFDRDSAYEFLKRRGLDTAAAGDAASAPGTVAEGGTAAASEGTAGAGMSDSSESVRANGDGGSKEQERGTAASGAVEEGEVTSAAIGSIQSEESDKLQAQDGAEETGAVSMEEEKSAVDTGTEKDSAEAEKGSAEEEKGSTEEEKGSEEEKKNTVDTEEEKSADGEGDSAGEKSESQQAMAKRAKSSAKSLGNTVAGTIGRQVGKSIGSSFGSFGETLGGNIGASLGRGIINTLFKS